MAAVASRVSRMARSGAQRGCISSLGRGLRGSRALRGEGICTRGPPVACREERIYKEGPLELTA